MDHLSLAQLTDPAVREHAKVLLQRLTTRSAETKKQAFIMETGATLRGIKQQDLDALYQTMAELEPTEPKHYDCPITGQRYGLTSIVWQSENLCATAHGHIWKRDHYLQHLQKDTQLLVRADCWPTLEDPNRIHQDGAIKIRVDNDSGTTLPNLLQQLPWLTAVNFLQFSIAADARDQCADLIATLVLQKLPIVQALINYMHHADTDENKSAWCPSSTRLSRLTPLEAMKLIDHAHTIRISDLLATTPKLNFHRVDGTQANSGSKTGLATNELPDEEADNWRSTPATKLENKLHALIIATEKKARAAGSLQWLNETLGTYWSQLPMPAEKAKLPPVAVAPAIDLTGLDAGLDGKTRQKAAQTLSLPGVRQPTKLITKWYREWLEKIASNSIVYRTDPSGSQWEPIEEIIRENGDKDCRLLVITKNRNLFRLCTKLENATWLSTTLPGAWVKADGTPPHHPPPHQNRTQIDLLPADKLHLIDLWYTPAQNRVDQQVANLSFACDFENPPPPLSMAPQWIRHILSLIDTSLRTVSLQAVHPLNTENWLLNASILDLVKFNLRQEHFAYNYVCPGRLFNEQQIAAVIAAAPDLPTRAQAWDYCLALPELQQPANAIDIVFSL